MSENVVGKQQPSEEDAVLPVIRVAVLGSRGIGKHALILRYLRGFYASDFEATIEDKLRVAVEVDGFRCILEILDTTGQEDFAALRGQWMMGKDGYIFVFGLDITGSLHDLTHYYEIHKLLAEEDSEPKTVLLVGHRKDIVDEFPQKRIITVEEAQQWAEKWGAQYMEASAQTGYNIDKLFQTFIRNVRKTGKYISAQEYANICKRQWARVLIEPHANSAPNDREFHQLLQFFVFNPGLLKLIGTKVLLFCSVHYQPSVAKGFAVLKDRTPTQTGGCCIIL